MWELARKALLATLAALVAWAAIVAFTGGVDLRPAGVPFRSTNPIRLLYAAVVLLVAYAAIFRGAARRHLASLDARGHALGRTLGRRGPHAALVFAVLTFAVGMLYGVHVAGGSDSWGYISQADLWLAGDLVTEQPIATEVPWPDADATFAPLGYRPWVEKGAIVPIYAPGLPVLMAASKAIIGSCGPYVVVPLLGALMVLLTYWLGAQLWSSLVGVVSAALMATSPVFVYMVLNPMSDVPVSAFFLAGLVTALSNWDRRALWTGAAVSMAIFIRPNLAPLGAIFLALVVVRAPAGRGWIAFLQFCAAGLPLVAAVAAVNTYLYGAPWNSGYGSLDPFYEWEFLGQNVRQYSASLLHTETALIAIGVLPLLAIRRVPRHGAKALAFAIAFSAGVWLSYLFYTPYDAWWYLRFLLPAYPVMFVMVAIGVAMVLERFRGGVNAGALALLLAVPIAVLRVNMIREEAILTLKQTGVVYLSVGEYVRTALPENAVILTVQHSGSIRHYANRLTMRWDVLGGEWWPEAIDVLTKRGYRPYLVISGFEEDQFRRQFNLSGTEDAPGTIVAQMVLPEPVRIYDPLRTSNRGPDVMPAVEPCTCGRGR